VADKSNIEWTDATWNPIRARNLKTGKVGWHCEHSTTGCEFCYAEGFNKRLGTGLPFKPGHRKDIEIFLDEEMLLAPLRWKKPRMIFVCSMTDLFADFVKDGWIVRMLDVMFQTPHHTYQIPTKRADRMLGFMKKWGDLTGEDFEFKNARGPAATRKAHPSGRGQLFADMIETMGDPPPGCAFPTFDWMGGMIRWPLYPHNVWLGVSAERQQEADERIPLLLHTPAAVRFVSLEPLLGPIDLTFIGEPYAVDALHGPPDLQEGERLDWVIVGGESGANARRMDGRWARDIRDQCALYSTPFFFKQWGQHDPDTWDRVGKKAAGRLLDGVEHNGMPGRATA
jgi:protein gp37